MITLIYMLAFYLSAYWFSDTIKKHANFIYLLATAISAVTLLNETIIFVQGYVGTAFLLLVMFAGSFDKKTKHSKLLRKVRAEYSILGFITLTPHIILYIVNSFTDVANLELFGLLAYLVMVPLTIISFPNIRKKFTFKKWKYWQMYAYVAYAGIYVHLLMVSSTQALVYTYIFGVYAFLQVKNDKALSKSFKVALASVILIFSSFQVVHAVADEGVAVQTIVNPMSTSTSSYSGTVSTTLYTDGTYSASVAGFRGRPLQVEVTVTNNIIETVDVISDGTTGGRYSISVNQVASNIEMANTWNVDTINGTTISTSALIDAVQTALEGAIIQ